MFRWILISGIILLQLLHYSEALSNATSVYGVQSGAVAGKPAYMKCEISPNDTVDKMEFYWEKDSRFFAFGDKIKAGELRGRASIINSSKWQSVLKIDPVLVEDSGVFSCFYMAFQGWSKEFNLTVTKIPDVSAQTLQQTVKDGETTAVAECSALQSIPIAQIWFEDENGVKVASNKVESRYSYTKLENVTSILAPKWNKNMHGKSYTCVIDHPDLDEPIRKLLVDSINVQYEPTIDIQEDGENFPIYIIKDYEAGQSFMVECVAQGNPMPALSWKFLPFSQNNTNQTVEQEMPDNFVIDNSIEGKSLLSTSSLLGSGLNNGTIVCSAQNDVYSPINQSFFLGVFEIPTTTPAPTTTTEEQVTPVMTYKSGGLGATAIAVLVATVCFICIIVVIGIVRYFMTHKGEYYTNELKQAQSDPDLDVAAGGEEGGVGGDDVMTEAELLGSRKTEHFV